MAASDLWSRELQEEEWEDDGVLPPTDAPHVRIHSAGIEPNKPYTPTSKSPGAAMLQLPRPDENAAKRARPDPEAAGKPLGTATKLSKVGPPLSSSPGEPPYRAALYM